MGLSREILAGLSERLHAHAGFALPEWVVETRALARMSALDLDERSYLDLVRSARGAGELEALVEAVRVGETRFFRHRPHVDALLDVVVPAWRARGERSPFVWSAGCATGEEPYTLALVLAKALPRPSFSPAILGTDVSAEALAAARRATYPAAVLESVPEPWRGGLAIEGDVVRVRTEVASLVTFRQHNLADADVPRDPRQPSARGIDLVWCRNVLIYFGPEARRRALDRIVAALAPDGFLFVGYSETLRDVPGLRAIKYRDLVLWQKAAPESLPQRVSGSQRASTPESLAPKRASSPGIAPSQPVFGLSPARVPTSPPPAPARAGATLRLTAADPAGLAAEVRAALAAPGLRRLTIDLDAVDYLDDSAAPVLRRAGAAAEAAGIELSLRATRPGPQRWLRRNGLSGGGE